MWDFTKWLNGKRTAGGGGGGGGGCGSSGGGGGSSSSGSSTSSNTPQNCNNLVRSILAKFQRMNVQSQTVAAYIQNQHTTRIRPLGLFWLQNNIFSNHLLQIC